MDEGSVGAVGVVLFLSLLALKLVATVFPAFAYSITVAAAIPFINPVILPLNATLVSGL